MELLHDVLGARGLSTEDTDLGSFKREKLMET